MDLTNIVTNAAEGFDGLFEKAKALAAEHGMDGEIFDEVSAAAKDIMADGKVERDEVVARIKDILAEKGLPEEAVDPVTDTIMEHMEGSK